MALNTPICVPLFAPLANKQDNAYHHCKSDKHPYVIGKSLNKLVRRFA